MNISILSCDWGETKREDIQRLLDDVASHILRELRDPFHGTVRVMNLPTQDCPRTYFRRSGDSAYEINLTAQDRLWSKFAYQFAHELCHVLSGHDRLRDNPNNWFHEAICELASLFVLRRMGERWPHWPPYSNWSSYSSNLTAYAESLSERLHENSPTGSFCAWLSANEPVLRADPYLRDRNGVVAIRLLPIFEREPRGWNAVRLLPTTIDPIHRYIDAWRSSVDELDRPFVQRIAHAMASP